MSQTIATRSIDQLDSETLSADVAASSTNFLASVNGVPMKVGSAVMKQVFGASSSGGDGQSGGSSSIGTINVYSTNTYLKNATCSLDQAYTVPEDVCINIHASAKFASTLTTGNNKIIVQVCTRGNEYFTLCQKNTNEIFDQLDVHIYAYAGVKIKTIAQSNGTAVAAANGEMQLTLAKTGSDFTNSGCTYVVYPYSQKRSNVCVTDSDEYGVIRVTGKMSQTTAINNWSKGLAVHAQRLGNNIRYNMDSAILTAANTACDIATDYMFVDPGTSVVIRYDSNTVDKSSTGVYPSNTAIMQYYAVEDICASYSYCMPPSLMPMLSVRNSTTGTKLNYHVGTHLSTSTAQFNPYGTTAGNLIGVSYAYTGSNPLVWAISSNNYYDQYANLANQSMSAVLYRKGTDNNWQISYTPCWRDSVNSGDYSITMNGNVKRLRISDSQQPAWCHTLTSISYIGDSITAIDDYCFAYLSCCDFGTGILNSHIQYVDSHRTFISCIQLTQLTLPPGITGFNNTRATFAYCKNLREINLSDLTCCTCISNSTFKNCTSLNHIDLRNVTAINATGSSTEPFIGCTNLSDIAFDYTKLDQLTVTKYAFSGISQNDSTIRLINVPANVDLASFKTKCKQHLSCISRIKGKTGVHLIGWHGSSFSWNNTDGCSYVSDMS